MQIMFREVECHYREAPGDTNLKDPLWKMPETGVFTSFLRDGLMNGAFDLVVHSWKDLPLAEESGTTVVATLPRADPRDLLLIRRDAIEEMTSEGGKLIVLSSSPRRQFNLTPFLESVVPGVTSVQFRDVRGNIQVQPMGSSPYEGLLQTRMRKLMDPTIHDESLGCRPHGLVVAKAAVDRFIRSTREEFKESRQLVQGYISDCRCMVLPLSANPTAAAQGALGIEVSTAPEKEHVRKIVRSLNDRSTFDAASKEKELLNSYGGGCHQKIGCTILPRQYGDVLFLCGRTDNGLDLLDRHIKPRIPLLEDLHLREGEDPPPLQVGGAGGLSLFDREEDPQAGVKLIEALRKGDREVGLWIAKASALPSSPTTLIESINELNVPVWVAGTTTWRHLAKRGLWCTGTADGLGEKEDPDISAIAPTLKRWIKVTHCDAGERQHVSSGEAHRKDTLGTYTLKSKYTPQTCPSDLKTATHIFWGSGSAYAEAVRLVEDLNNRVEVHGCGPGHTFDALRDAGIPEERIVIVLNFSEFVDRVYKPKTR
ncbi:porphobilinogen deaminase, putative [Perkinsus marinus ATCC 50983]|uniref:hydroxymethylbilane synthase n=1 Tax=Perkinsus marinus (strain ATCC 50983 / TXsc) TaxID=423536 RepID=C5L743_PERM5|nr:porphobilinogen deaminase, putative [Perkinsus marinus ATCC 50983]EER07305.1 porphobilinogen deaminase, putative [Perkinsus marinus ATCC 50983]|eukprot:XP_002775489.1 porphobilinogen deaminase, putative [Perkinsus marinus ATCC 50983]